MKIEINSIYGQCLYSHEEEYNTIAKTINAAIKSGANLSEANLTRANLSGANLTGANLSEANLTRANLSEANLTGANLIRADLSGANLSWANLTGAYLREAIRNGKKIKQGAQWLGLYKYRVMALIYEDDYVDIEMGCFTRSLQEWENDFWNNPIEFPNYGDEASKMRLAAFNYAKEWVKIKTEAK